MSLRTRLIIAFLFLSVVPLSAVTAFWYASSVAAFERAAEREATQTATEIGRRMELITSAVGRRVDRLVDVSLSGDEGDLDADDMRARLAPMLGDAVSLVERVEFHPAPAPAPAGVDRPGATGPPGPPPAAAPVPSPPVPPVPPVAGTPRVPRPPRAPLSAAATGSSWRGATPAGCSSASRVPSASRSGRSAGCPSATSPSGWASSRSRASASCRSPAA